MDDENGAKEKKKETNRSKFRSAINKVRLHLSNSPSVVEMNGSGSSNGGNGIHHQASATSSLAEGAAATVKIRNVEMLTLGTNDAGLPIRKYFDWTIGSINAANDDGIGGELTSAVIMYGDMVNEDETSDRARDAELIDFFQNAPIAMHWLNGEGIVLWANQTELNVLGYTAEEYIGQPIMNFCPDEKELVLEIFKQLGSGNSIADVPVRFRTKDGRMVHLLIDSNVAYNKDGSFGHTRCFIRDDTARKIRDARTKLLLEETERSLRMLDGFLSRTLHHVMGPLHALRGTCDVIRDRIDHQIQFGLCVNKDEDERNCRLLEQAADTVMTTTRMVADVSDLARFHEGANLKTKFRFTNLRDVGLEAIKRIQFHALRLSGRDDGITVSVKLIGRGGPAVAYTDQSTLLRVLAHLMENAVREVDSGGQVTLQITSLESNTLYEVLDNGKGLPPGTCLDQGSGFDTVAAPTIHRYALGGTGHGLSSNDPDEIQKVRAEMEAKLRDLKQNGVGAGLPLSYHLVRSLSGDLRHDSSYTGGTRIWFALPTQKDSNGTGDNEEVGDLLITETLFKKDAHPPTLITTTATRQLPERKRKKIEDPTFSNFSSDSGSTTSGDETTVPPPKSEVPAPAAVAKCGVKASLPFSVLVVEDTDICARLLMMQLKKMKCSTQRAENGRVAVDLLKDSLPGTFDMVLMDLRMPVMDGMEATKFIRTVLQMKDLPIIALTGEMSADIRNECESIGFDGFFQKPLKKEQLEGFIGSYNAARF
ncbi:hypothetical protein ACHAXH_001626 [Discostella pseudostelligera]